LLTYCISGSNPYLLSSGKESGRKLSVFPPVHIVVAYSNQIFYELKEALQFVQEKYEGKLPSMISIATGPSRTAGNLNRPC